MQLEVPDAVAPLDRRRRVLGGGEHEAVQADPRPGEGGPGVGVPGLGSGLRGPGGGPGRRSPRSRRPPRVLGRDELAEPGQPGVEDLRHELGGQLLRDVVEPAPPGPLGRHLLLGAHRLPARPEPRRPRPGHAHDVDALDARRPLQGGLPYHAVPAPGERDEQRSPHPLQADPGGAARNAAPRGQPGGQGRLDEEPASAVALVDIAAHGAGAGVEEGAGVVPPVDGVPLVPHPAPAGGPARGLGPHCAQAGRRGHGGPLRPGPRRRRGHDVEAGVEPVGQGPQLCEPRLVAVLLGLLTGQGEVRGEHRAQPVGHPGAGAALQDVLAHGAQTPPGAPQQVAGQGAVGEAGGELGGRGQGRRLKVDQRPVGGRPGAAVVRGGPVAAHPGSHRQAVEGPGGGGGAPAPVGPERLDGPGGGVSGERPLRGRGDGRAVDGLHPGGDGAGHDRGPDVGRGGSGGGAHAQVAEDGAPVHRQRRAPEALGRLAPVRADEHAVLVPPDDHPIRPLVRRTGGRGRARRRRGRDRGRWRGRPRGRWRRDWPRRRWRDRGRWRGRARRRRGRRRSPGRRRRGRDRTAHDRSPPYTTAVSSASSRPFSIHLLTSFSIRENLLTIVLHVQVRSRLMNSQ